MRTPITIALTFLACGLAVTACQSTSTESGKARTGESLVQGAKTSKTHVMAQKTNAAKTTTPPKAVPKAVTSGTKSIAPPAIGAGVICETWEIDQIDLHGGGIVESGVAMYDADSDTLMVWFEDAADLYGTGDVVTYDGFLWISDASVGLILDLRAGGEEDIVAVAKTVDGFSGLIVADSEGDTDVMALEASFSK